MPEIGQTLREARMRAKIDISEVEAETKIRAKYLRALENEEWGLLPGSTFVRTFLRTYAEYLGLDAKLLIEEYKVRFEPMSTAELTPFSPAIGGHRERLRPRGPSPGAVIAGVLVAVVALLFLIGQLFPDDAGDEDAGDAARPAITVPEDEGQPARGSRRRPTGTPATRRAVRLQVVPTGRVWVCLVDAGGRELIPGTEIGPDAAARSYRSRRFRITLGNGQATLRVDGRTVDVPDRSVPVGFSVSARGRTELSQARQPTCA